MQKTKRFSVLLCAILIVSMLVPAVAMILPASAEIEYGKEGCYPPLDKENLYDDPAYNYNLTFPSNAINETPEFEKYALDTIVRKFGADGFYDYNAGMVPSDGNNWFRYDNIALELRKQYTTNFIPYVSYVTMDPHNGNYRFSLQLVDMSETGKSSESVYNPYNGGKTYLEGLKDFQFKITETDDEIIITYEDVEQFRNFGTTTENLFTIKPVLNQYVGVLPYFSNFPFYSEYDKMFNAMHYGPVPYNGLYSFSSSQFRSTSLEWAKVKNVNLPEVESDETVTRISKKDLTNGVYSVSFVVTFVIKATVSGTEQVRYCIAETLAEDCRESDVITHFGDAENGFDRYSYKGTACASYIPANDIITTYESRYVLPGSSIQPNDFPVYYGNNLDQLDDNEFSVIARTYRYGLTSLASIKDQGLGVFCVTDNIATMKLDFQDYVYGCFADDTAKIVNKLSGNYIPLFSDGFRNGFNMMELYRVYNDGSKTLYASSEVTENMCSQNYYCDSYIVDLFKTLDAGKYEVRILAGSMGEGNTASQGQWVSDTFEVLPFNVNNVNLQDYITIHQYVYKGSKNNESLNFFDGMSAVYASMPAFKKLSSLNLTDEQWAQFLSAYNNLRIVYQQEIDAFDYTSINPNDNHLSILVDKFADLLNMCYRDYYEDAVYGERGYYTFDDISGSFYPTTWAKYVITNLDGFVSESKDSHAWDNLAKDFVKYVDFTYGSNLYDPINEWDDPQGVHPYLQLKHYVEIYNEALDLFKEDCLKLGINLSSEIDACKYDTSIFDKTIEFIKKYLRLVPIGHTNDAGEIWYYPMIDINIPYWVVNELEKRQAIDPTVTYDDVYAEVIEDFKNTIGTVKGLNFPLPIASDEDFRAEFQTMTMKFDGATHLPSVLLYNTANDTYLFNTNALYSIDINDRVFVKTQGFEELYSGYLPSLTTRGGFYDFVSYRITDENGNDLDTTVLESGTHLVNFKFEGNYTGEIKGVALNVEKSELSEVPSDDIKVFSGKAVDVSRYFVPESNESAYESMIVSNYWVGDTKWYTLTDYDLPSQAHYFDVKIYMYDEAKDEYSIPVNEVLHVGKYKMVYTLKEEDQKNFVIVDYVTGKVLEEQKIECKLEIVPKDVAVETPAISGEYGTTISEFIAKFGGFMDVDFMDEVNKNFMDKITIDWSKSGIIASEKPFQYFDGKAVPAVGEYKLRLVYDYVEGFEEDFNPLSNNNVEFTTCEIDGVQYSCALVTVEVNKKTIEVEWEKFEGTGNVLVKEYDGKQLLPKAYIKGLLDSEGKPVELIVNPILDAVGVGEYTLTLAIPEAYADTYKLPMDSAKYTLKITPKTLDLKQPVSQDQKKPVYKFGEIINFIDSIEYGEQYFVVDIYDGEEKVGTTNVYYVDPFNHNQTGLYIKGYKVRFKNVDGELYDGPLYVNNEDIPYLVKGDYVLELELVNYNTNYQYTTSTLEYEFSVEPLKVTEWEIFGDINGETVDTYDGNEKLILGRFFVELANGECGYVYVSNKVLTTEEYMQLENALMIHPSSYTEYDGYPVFAKALTVLSKTKQNTLINADTYDVTFESTKLLDSMFDTSAVTKKIINSFTILPKEINLTVYSVYGDENTVLFDDMDPLVFTGKELKPSFVLVDDEGNVLGSEYYTVTYTDNVNAGVATISIKPIAGMNYTFDDIDCYFDIIPATPYYHDATEEDNITITDAGNYVYNGTGITPSYEIKFNDLTLVEGVDYTLALSNNVIPGIANVVINFQGNLEGEISTTFEIGKLRVTPTWEGLTASYTGSKHVPTAYFVLNDVKYYFVLSAEKEILDVGSYVVTITDVEGTNMSYFDVAVSSNTVVITPCVIDESNIGATITETEAFKYNGTAIKPTIQVVVSGKTLVEGVDYDLTYTNNVNVGTAAATIKLKGNYTGTKTVNYTIEAVPGDVYITINNGVYTGSAVEPLFVVIINGTTTILVENKDYTYVYSNNVNASGEAKVDITLIGNYIGSASKYFTILPYEITDETQNLSVKFDGNFEFNGSKIVPSVEVKLGENTLVSGTDYDFEITNNVNAGNASVKFTFQGNYAGTLTKEFTITSKVVTDATVQLSATAFDFDGTAKAPTAVVVVAGKTLVAGTDYELTYENNTNAGTAKAVVTFKGNYEGTASTNFTIKATKFTAEDVNLSIETLEFDGSAKTPAIVITVDGKTLVEGVDFEAQFQNNTNAGTATLNITGKGNYAGNVEKSFTITPKTLSNDTANFAVNFDSAYSFTGKEQTPSPVITLNGTTLVKDVDYTITYTNNKNVGNATASITFQGNYAGTVEKNFVISEASLTANDIQFNQESFVFDGTAKTPTITIKNGDLVLVEGTDYDVTFANNTNAGAAKAIVTFKGNYTGTVEKTFTINGQPVNADNIVLASDPLVYDGTAKTPSVTIKVGDVTLVAGTDYELIYSDNTNAGNGTVKVVFKGNYAGEQTLTFEIKKATYDMSNVSFEDINVKENETFTPAIKGTLPNGVTVSFSTVDTSVAGIYDIVATFTGDANHEAIEAMTAKVHVKVSSITPKEDVKPDEPQKPQEKPVVVIESEEGFDSNIELHIEVSVDVDVRQEAILEEAYDINLNEYISRKEEIVAVYGVELWIVENGESRRIQPSELGNIDSKLIARIEIPENIKDKSYRILHIHSGDDVTTIEKGDVAGIGTFVIEDGHIVTVLDKFSDFAFVVEKTDNAWHWVVIGLIVLSLAYIAYTLVKKNANRMSFIVVIVACALEIAFAFIGIIQAACFACVITMVIGIIVCAIGACLFLKGRGNSSNNAALDAVKTNKEKENAQ